MLVELGPHTPVPASCKDPCPEIFSAAGLRPDMRPAIRPSFAGAQTSCAAAPPTAAGRPESRLEAVVASSSCAVNAASALQLAPVGYTQD